MLYYSVKDTHREKAPSDKASAHTKNMNIGILVVSISNELFIRGSLSETKFSKKNKDVTGKTPFFAIGQ